MGTYLRRALRSWFVILFVLLFAWIDWLGHHNPLVAIGGPILAIAAVLVWPDVVARLGLGSLLARIPERGRPVLFALPGLGFVLWRAGSGPQTASTTYASFVSLAVVVLLALFGPRVDERLSTYYRVRDVIPRIVRMVVSPFLAILLSFVVVHGPANLSLLVGGSPRVATSAANPLLFVIAVLLSTAVVFLLLRPNPAAQKAAA